MSLVIRPFGKIIENKENSIILDAVYIPTLKSRSIPMTNLKWLLRYAKEIVLLFSEEYAEWSINLGENIRVENMKNKEFCKEYLKKNENKNDSVKWRPDFDIPLKRSYALFDAKIRNYKYILFLDDDIKMSENNMCIGLGGLSQEYTVLGFHVTDYPDVSTIDHIERIVEGCSNIISMTGSCMFLNVENVIGDFPLIYNEDLFFFMKQIEPQKIVSGGTIMQNEYQPWASYSRIKHEQFGDLIYEAFKKRFINIETSPIKWEEEICLRLKRIDRLRSKISRKDFIDALSVAYEGTSVLTY